MVINIEQRTSVLLRCRNAILEMRLNVTLVGEELYRTSNSLRFLKENNQSIICGHN